MDMSCVWHKVKKKKKKLKERNNHLNSKRARVSVCMYVCMYVCVYVHARDFYYLVCVCACMQETFIIWCVCVCVYVHARDLLSGMSVCIILLSLCLWNQTPEPLGSKTKATRCISLCHECETKWLVIN